MQSQSGRGLYLAGLSSNNFDQIVTSLILNWDMQQQLAMVLVGELEDRFGSSKNHFKNFQS